MRRSYIVREYLGLEMLTTGDSLLLNQLRKLVFVYPWIHYLQGPSSGVTWRSHSDSDTDSAPDSDCDTGLDKASGRLAVTLYRVWGFCHCTRLKTPLCYLDIESGMHVVAGISM